MRSVINLNRSLNTRRFLAFLPHSNQSYYLLSTSQRSITIMSEPPAKKSKVESTYKGDALELKCVNTIRALSADMPQAAKSGHPGAPMGCAPLAYLLWCEFMNYSPSNPKWWNRDRFVLSNGHACALQYAMLHLSGYNLTIEDLKQFRSIGSKTPGHPENFMTDGESKNVWKERVKFLKCNQS